MKERIAISKRGCAILGIILLLVLLFQAREKILMAERVPVAKELYKVLGQYEFDGVDYNYGAADEMLLFCYIEQEGSSVRARKEVAVIKGLQKVEQAKRYFENIRSFRGGVLFACSISWDGEWSGLFIGEGGKKQIQEFVREEWEDNVYYASTVPEVLS